MTFHDYDEPPNLAELRTAELLVERAWPEKPERQPLVTGQGRRPEGVRHAAQIVGTCFGLLVLLGLAGLGYRVVLAVVERVLESLP